MTITRVGWQTCVVTSYGVTIWWNNVYNVIVEVLGRHFNNVIGLCGTFNNDKSDDLLTSGDMTTTDVAVFGNSWKTDSNCDDVPLHHCVANPDHAEIARQQCSALLRAPFWSCNQTVNATEEQFISDCEYDMCACENSITCLCQIFDAYSSACSAENININWLDDFPQCSKNCYCVFLYLLLACKS